MSWRSRTIVFGCLALALMLRIWGLDFGLPYDLHPDEHQYVDMVLDWYTTGEMGTRFTNPPFFNYILTGAFMFWFALSPFEFSAELLSSTYFYARLWSVVFGVLTVALMHPLGKRLYREKAGVFGVVLLTGLFLPAREAHFAVNDAIVTFLVLLTVYYSLKVYHTARMIDYLSAGIGIGLATGAKLTAALVVLPLLVSHFFTLTKTQDISLKEILRIKPHLRLGFGLLAGLITFLVITIHIIWPFPQFLQEMYELFQFGIQGFGGTRMAPATGWQFYIAVFGWGIGWTMLGAILAVVGYVFFKRQPEGVILSIFPIVLFTYMGAQKAFSARYLLPAVPPLVALVAVGIARLERHQLIFRRYHLLFEPFIVLVLVVQSVINLVWFNHLLTLPNTQQLATDWFIRSYPEETVVAKEPFSILPDSVYLNNHWPYKTITLDKSDPTRSDVNYYFSYKTQIVALSNYTFARIRQDPIAEKIRLRQLSLLEEKATLIKEFYPYRRPNYDDWFYLDQLYGPAGETLQRVRAGPLIKIYQLPYESQPFSLDIPEISVPVHANFANKIMLLGYDLPTRRAKPGESLPLTLYWQALTRMSETYVIFDHLLDNQQQNWGGYDRWPQETANTTLWHPGEVVVDTFSLPVAADAPDGVYTIDIGLYDQSDQAGTPLPLIINGQPIDQNSITIGPVKVGGPPPGVTLLPAQVKPRVEMEVPFGIPPVIALRGYDLNSRSDNLVLKLYWVSQAQTRTDWSIFVHIRDQAGNVVAQKDGPAGSGVYPTSLWEAGEAVVDDIFVAMPPGDGWYSLVIGLYDINTGTRLVIPNDSANEVLLDEFSPTEFR